MKRIPKSRDSQLLILQRRRAIYEVKVAQERFALEHGGMPAANPSGYKHVPGESRSQRLAKWETSLLDISREIAEEEERDQSSQPTSSTISASGNIEHNNASE